MSNRSSAQGHHPKMLVVPMQHLKLDNSMQPNGGITTSAGAGKVEKSVTHPAEDASMVDRDNRDAGESCVIKTVHKPEPLSRQSQINGIKSAVQLASNGTAILSALQSCTEGNGVLVAGSPSHWTPSSQTSTPPKLRIAPCPARLRCLIPPKNYGTVEHRTIYRASFPTGNNVEFLKMLHIKHVLTFVGTEPTREYKSWIEGNGIKRTEIDIAPNKEDKISTTVDSLCRAILFILDNTHYPLLVHCNQGRHRTGCVVACLRKVQRWPLRDILDEYCAYAWPKARDADIRLITSFDPACIFDYAKSNGYFDDGVDTMMSGIANPNAPLKRLDSGIVNIDMLAEALQSGALAPSGEDIPCDLSCRSTSASPPGSSVISDGPLEMRPFNFNSKEALAQAIAAVDGSAVYDPEDDDMAP